MGFPLTDPNKFPLGLGYLLDVMADAGTLRHLSVARTTEGEWHASHKTDSGGYKVVIKPTPWEAILGALAPSYGHPWSEVVPGSEELENLGGVEEDDDVEDLL